jgi:RNA polymerase sigma-70 factor (ECF subfamily)
MPSLPPSSNPAPPDPSDGIGRETIRLAKSGDEGALTKILNQYRPYLLFIANRELDPALAGRTSPSDVVQDTVVQLHQNIGTFAGESEAELKAWLRTSLNNRIKDNRRFHLQKKRSVASEAGLPSSNFEDSGTPSKMLQNKERFSAVENGLQSLPPKDQEVLRLRHEEGLAFSKIGEKLGVSGDVARMTWVRAIEKLKKHIQGNGEV